MPFCNVDIHRKEDGLFSVKLDGEEISQSITGFSFSVQGHELPILTIQIAAEGFNLSSPALLEIPEPYGSFIRYKNRDTPL